MLRTFGVLLACLLCIRAAAAQCPSSIDSDLRPEAPDPSVRLAWIRGQLARDARHSRIWSYTFASLYGAIVTYNLALLPVRDEAGRIDSAFAAGAAGVGVLSIVLGPRKVIADERRLEQQLATRQDVCVQLAEAERLLVRDAADEKFGQSPMIHIGNFLFNWGLGLALGFGFGHYTTGMISMLTGTAVGEVQILTQPTGAERALEEYRRGALGPPSAARRLSLVPMHDGIGIAGTF